MENIKKPKYIQKIEKHLFDCYNKHHCIHCFDCIAFALLYAEDNLIHVKKYPNPLPDKLIYFSKYLYSAINRDYLPCKYALTGKQVKIYKDWLSRLSIEEKRKYRSMLLCHSELGN